MSEAGVYEIRNTLDGKVYVGSSVNVRRRLGNHRSGLRRGDHDSHHLQAAWQKYGAENFAFRHLIICAPKDLHFYEQIIVDGYKANDPAFGYNQRVVVESCRGRKYSEERKAQLRAVLPRGEAHHNHGKSWAGNGPEISARLRRGKRISAEHKENIATAKLGVPMPAGFGEKMRAIRTGAKHSAITRARMSAARGKLDRAKAEEIRALHAKTGKSKDEIAEMYGVSSKAILRILGGKTWA